VRRHRPQFVVLAVIVLALLATAWLPFVDGPHLWFGLPSVLVWSAGWVLAITPALAWLEFSRTAADEPDEERTVR
jgi:predicted MFS family arabinose efflux permease